VQLNGKVLKLYIHQHSLTVIASTEQVTKEEDKSGHGFNRFYGRSSGEKVVPNVLVQRLSDSKVQWPGQTVEDCGQL
jgi:hypothetical protein